MKGNSPLRYTEYMLVILLFMTGQDENGKEVTEKFFEVGGGGVRKRGVYRTRK